MSRSPGIAYIVCDDARGYCCWLVLSPGPFAYPDWVGAMNAATPMTKSLACAYANAYGLVVDNKRKTRLVPVFVSSREPDVTVNKDPIHPGGVD